APSGPGSKQTDRMWSAGWLSQSGGTNSPPHQRRSLGSPSCSSTSTHSLDVSGEQARLWTAKPRVSGMARIRGCMGPGFVSFSACLELLVPQHPGVVAEELDVVVIDAGDPADLADLIDVIGGDQAQVFAPHRRRLRHQPVVGTGDRVDGLVAEQKQWIERIHAPDPGRAGLAHPAKVPNARIIDVKLVELALHEG